MVTVVLRGQPDSDPREYGWTDATGQRWVHPAYGPTRTAGPHPYLTRESL